MSSIKEVYTNLEPVFKKYIDTTDANLCLLRTWVIGTYLHSQFETFPLLHLNAQKRSGKTRTLKLCSSLSYGSDGTVMTNPSETFLFRHSEGAVFFDEMEDLNAKEQQSFRQTLNAVYKKGNQIVKYREKFTKGKGREFVEEVFRPFYPLALANIAGAGDVLGDRSIQIILQRSSRPQTQLIEDFSSNPIIQSLKGELVSLKAKIPEALFTKWNSFIEGTEIENQALLKFFTKVKESKIHGRALEIFFPFFVIAYLGGYLEEMLKVAKDYVTSQEEEESAMDYDELLKKCVSTLDPISSWDNKGNPVQLVPFMCFVPIKRILEVFRASLDSPEAWVNERWLGRALKRLGLVRQKRRMNNGIEIILNKTTLTTDNTYNTLHTQTTQDNNIDSIPPPVVSSSSATGSQEPNWAGLAADTAAMRRRMGIP